MLLIASCSRFHSNESIFLENKKCLDKDLSCSFRVQGKEIFQISFGSDPRIKDTSYQLVVNPKVGNVVSVTADLIGMNMEMPLNQISLSQNSIGEFQSLITPGLCTENKMLWRLKINLVLSDKTRYYTFINYQVGR